MTAKTRAEFLFKEQSFFGWLLFSQRPLDYWKYRFHAKSFRAN